MPIPDWSKQPDYDVLYLGGKFVPCAVARVEVKLPSGLDIKKGKGKKKATITDDGDPPADVDIEIDLLPEHMALFAQDIIPLLRPGGKAAARPPLEISHPNTRLWGINVITPGEISSPMPASGGLWTISIKSHEWCPAPTEVKNKKNEKPKNDDDAWAHLKKAVTGPFTIEALSRALRPDTPIGPPLPPDHISPEDRATVDAAKQALSKYPSALRGLLRPSKDPAGNI